MYRWDTEGTLYVIGWLLPAGLLVLALVAWWNPDVLHFFFQTCMVYRITGSLCPGSGGSRAVNYLLAGDLLRSIVAHPLVIYGVVFYLAFMVTQTISRLTGGRVRGIRFRDAYAYIGIAILMLNLMIKNYFLLVKGINLIP